jgi:YD repeat-containing protein
LKTISYPDTATVSYTYDKLAPANRNQRERRCEFGLQQNEPGDDGDGRVWPVVDYNYDVNGNRTKLSLNSVIVESYKYDAVNRLTKILDAAGAAFTFDYDVTNKLTQKKSPNGVKTTYQFDGLDRVTRLLDTKALTPSPIASINTKASQITQIAEPAITRSYEYDAVDRLTTALHQPAPTE